MQVVKCIGNHEGDDGDLLREQAFITIANEGEGEFHFDLDDVEVVVTVEHIEVEGE